MSNDLFSPINLSGPYISECDLYVSHSAPSGDLVCNVKIKTPKDLKFEHSEEEYTLFHAMKISIELLEMNGEEVASEAMRANLTMRGIISVTDKVKAEVEEVKESLLLNGVSLFYSAARSYIEFLTSMSPMGRFTIPAINPKAYVDSLSTE